MWLLTVLLLADTSRAFSTALAPAESVGVRVEGVGDPVVLIPGLFGSAFGYRTVLPRLVEAGDRTIVIEPLGIGTSGRPEHADYSLTAQADRVAAALDRLGVGGVIGVAPSVGAAVAHRLADRRAPLGWGVGWPRGGPAPARGGWPRAAGGPISYRGGARRRGGRRCGPPPGARGWGGVVGLRWAPVITLPRHDGTSLAAGRPAARTRAGRWALSWCARPRRGSHLHRSGARCVGDRSRAPGAPGPDAAPRAGAAARRDARDSERRLHPRVSRRGGRWTSPSRWGTSPSRSRRGARSAPTRGARPCRGKSSAWVATCTTTDG